MAWRADKQSALPEPVGITPKGILMATSQSDRFISPFITCPQKNKWKKKKRITLQFKYSHGFAATVMALVHLAMLENHQESSEVIGTSLARTVRMLLDFNWKVGQYGEKTRM